MELVEGGNLADQIRGVLNRLIRRLHSWRRWPKRSTRRIRAVSCIATSSRPTSCSPADGTPKVTDFGLARRLEGDGGLTLSGAPLGTPSYMAPEQVRGKKAGDRAGHGRVRPGGDPVRAAHGPAAVPRRDRDGDAPAGADRRASVSDTAEPAGAARPDDDLPEVPVQGAAPALRQRRRTGGRPPPISSRGSTIARQGRAVRAPRPMGAA